MNALKTSTSMVLAGVLVLASCGGGDNAREVLQGGDDTVPATDPPVTDPPATDPPVSTEPPVSEAPVTQPAVDDPPTTDPTTGDPSDAGDISAFCGASAQFYVEAQALNEIPGDDDAAAEVLFDRMQISLPAALLNSPSEELSAAPRRVEEIFGILIPALETLGYNFDELESLDNAEEVGASFLEFADIIDQLKTFLSESCGVDTTALDAESVALGAAVETDGLSTPTSDPEPTGTDVPTDVGALSVADDSGTITATVPAAWSDVRGEPQGEQRRLIAAPDAEAFLAGFSEPGMILLVGDVPDGTGAEDAQSRLGGLETNIQESGCSQNVRLSYDDGVYVGDESIYSCSADGSTVRLAGGTNAAGDLFWLLAVVYQDGDEETWTQIADSFLVD